MGFFPKTRHSGELRVICTQHNFGSRVNGRLSTIFVRKKRENTHKKPWECIPPLPSNYNITYSPCGTEIYLKRAIISSRHRYNYTGTLTLALNPERGSKFRNINEVEHMCNSTIFALKLKKTTNSSSPQFNKQLINCVQLNSSSANNVKHLKKIHYIQ